MSQRGWRGVRAIGRRWSSINLGLGERERKKDRRPAEPGAASSSASSARSGGGGSGGGGSRSGGLSEHGELLLQEGRGSCSPDKTTVSREGRAGEGARRARGVCVRVCVCELVKLPPPM